MPGIPLRFRRPPNPSSKADRPGPPEASPWLRSRGRWRSPSRSPSDPRGASLATKGASMATPCSGGLGRRPMTNPARSRTAAAPLAVAAAALASGEAADATTLNESTDFGNTFAQRTLLPSGTDVVNGSVFAFEADANDFITFQGLSSGLSFTLDATNTGDDQNVLFFSHLDAAGGVIGTPQSGTSVQLMGTIPGSGQLNFGI